MAEKSTTREIQTAILRFAAGAFIVIGMAIGLVSFWPLYNEMKKNQERQLMRAVADKKVAIQEFLDGAKDSAMQVTSRTAIREKLEAYYAGKVPLGELTAFTEAKLLDAVERSSLIVGISRVDRNGSPIAHVGKSIPQHLWVIPQDGLRVAEIGLPFADDGKTLLVVGAPVLDRSFKRVGTDIILVDLSRLRSIVENPSSLGATEKVFLGMRNPKTPLLIFGSSSVKGSQFPTPIDDSLTNEALRRAFLDESGMLDHVNSESQPYTVAYAPIAGTNWGLAIRVSKDEFYGSMWNQLFLTGAFIIVSVFLGTLGMIFVIRPLTGKLIFRAEDLEQEIQAKTAQLKSELAQRKKAEEALTKARDELEQRVAERTKELASLNKELAEDISQRKKAEEALLRLNRELRAISDCNQTIMRAVDEQTLLNDICRIVCNQAGYPMAWVGFAENDEAKTVRPVAWAGVEEGYLATANITWSDTERGRGPSGTAIREGKSSCIQDFSTDPHAAPWRERAAERGYRSSIALPLKDESESTFGILCIYSSEPKAFTPEEIRLLGELSEDLAFGIVVLRTRIERRRAEEDLRKINERFSLATRAASLGVWDWDIQKNELVWDDGMYALYGIKREDFAGAYEAWLKGVHPDDRARSDEISKLAQRGEREYDTEFRVVWPDGSIHYLKACGQILRDTGGRPLRMTGINFDVTELKRAEQERLDHLLFFESLDKVNRAIQGSPDVDSLMSDVLDAVLSIFDCDRAWLFYPCDPDAPSFRVPMEISKPEYPGAKLLNVDLPMPPDMAQNLREALESVGPVTYTAGTEKPINKVSADQFGVKSMMMVALYPKSGEPWAFGLHQCSYPRVWTSEEQRLFQEIGRRLEDGLSATLAHRNLQDSEVRFRTVFEQGPLGMSILRANLERVAINAKLTKMFGYTKEELRKLTFLDLTHPDDLELTREHLDKLLKKEIPSYQIEKRYIKKGGEIIWVRVMLSAVRDSQGELLYLVSMIEEITEHKRDQEAVRRANKDWEQTFDAIPDMVMVLDTQHRIIRANKAMAAVLGRSEKELQGRFCFELFHDENAPPAFCPHSILLKDGKEHSTEVFEPKLGRSLDVRVSPLSDETGTVIGSVHVVRDVTEQKNLQKQLLQAQKMESIGTLAGGIAHDFNNLLQIVLGYSDMLLFNKKPTDPDYERLHAIREAGKGGAELAKGILAFSRRLEPNARPIDLNNEIIRVQRMLERTIPKMITIQILLAHKLMTVNADPGQMEQVLLNLAVNAQHAMPDGGRLTIETANVTLDEEYSRTHLGVEPGKYVLLTVSDTGQGMDKEVLEHIFEPFYTTKEPGVGTGLGLAMAFGIVKSHKGHISCYSEPGTGTTFKIYLPAIVQEIEQDVAVTRQMPAFGTETILLVDDEKSIRKLGEEMLRMAGYTVLTATNGREALEIYHSNQDRIALVLLDLMMPEMGGKQCLKELLKINPGVRVVIASGYSANGPTKDALSAGAKGFVNKPYDVRQVLAVARKVLDAS